MRNIIIIENQDIGSESIANIFWQGPEKYSIITAHSEQAAQNIIQDKPVDLVIFDLCSAKKEREALLVRLAHRFPYLPCIAIIDQDEPVSVDAAKTTACKYMHRPLQTEELYQQVEALLEVTTSGTVKGFPIHSLLQMFESEMNTCTLKVQAKDDMGLIFVENGEVVAAETSNQQNEDAIYSIITWEETIVEILYYNCQRKKSIEKPLISLIMESFRLKDERDSLSKSQKNRNKPQLELKHLSTAANRISLEIGATIKMEFNNVESPLVSTMVGMVPNQYLVVSTPVPFSVVEEAIARGGRIVVKYLHMGRLCMFKTHVLTSIVEPFKLLFLDYPPIIHYHELRRAKRTAIFIPCTFHPPAGGEYYGVLVDLSSMGSLCHIKAKGNAEFPEVDVNNTVRLRCMLPGVKEDPELNGVVKNIRKSSSELQIGIEFVDLGDDLMKTIDRYLYSVNNIVS